MSRLRRLWNPPQERLLRLFAILASPFDIALVSVELLLNRCLCLRLLTVRMRLERKLRVAELAGSDYGNVANSLYDAKVALCHVYIVSQIGTSPPAEALSIVLGDQSSNLKTGMHQTQKCCFLPSQFGTGPIFLIGKDC